MSDRKTILKKLTSFCTIPVTIPSLGGTRKQTRIFWILIAAGAILLFVSGIYNSRHVGYICSFYCLLCAVGCLHKLLKKHVWLDRILSLLILCVWNILFLMFYLFKMTNFGGLNLENVYHLLCFQGWLEFMYMDPLLAIGGILALILLICLTFFLTYLLSWCVGDCIGRNMQAVFSGLFALFTALFFYNNVVFLQLGDIMKEFAFSQKYVTLKQEEYDAHGIKLCPLPWHKVQASPGKNLVYIILESTELTFLDQKLFPGLLPNLLHFRESAQSFENMSMAHNARITFGAMYSAMTGSYLTPAHAKGWWNPNITSSFSSLSKVLHNAGYEQHFLIGHSGDFAGMENFIIDQQYDSFWSGIDCEKRTSTWEYCVRDSAVFRQAWRTFQKLAEKNTPFNITLLTTDAHAPHGFYSPEEPAYPYPSAYPKLYNAMYASDHALGDFIKKIKDHPKYKDTCIVITSDHLAHYYAACTDILQQSSRRRLLFLIDNSSVKSWKADVPALTFDIAPTILDSMGVKHNYRFPLGESLYQNPDPRRLNYTKEQERVLSFYVLLKNENRNLRFPLEISVHTNPFPFLQINSHRLPLLIGEANDTPREGEILAVRLPRKNEPIRWRTHYFKSFSFFRVFLNSNPGDIIFLGKTGSERLPDMDKPLEPQTFFLGSIIHGKKQMVFDRKITNLKLYCQ